jgi:hypothetical protein
LKVLRVAGVKLYPPANESWCDSLSGGRPIGVKVLSPVLPPVSVIFSALWRLWYAVP